MKVRATRLARLICGTVAALSFAAFWCWGWFYVPRMARAPDALHRFAFPWKVPVYLASGEALVGYGLVVTIFVTAMAYALLREYDEKRSRP